MIQFRAYSKYLGFFLIWCVGIVWLTIWARKPERAWVGPMLVFPWLIGISAFAIIWGVSIIFSKRRPFILSLSSLLVGSVLIAFWIGSTRVQYMVGMNGSSRFIEIGGEQYFEGSAGNIIASSGGIGVLYHSELLPAKRYSESNLRARASFGLGKPGNPTQVAKYPDLGRDPYSKSAEAIRTHAGFAFCWFTADKPPVAGVVNDLTKYGIIVPFWFPILLCTVFPAFHLRVILREARRKRLGLCVCGFDLRAHKPGDPCPECGAPKPVPAAKSNSPAASSG